MLQAPRPPPRTEGPRKGQQFVACEGSEPTVLVCKISWANFKPCVSNGEVICSGKKAASPSFRPLRPFRSGVHGLTPVQPGAAHNF